MLCRLARGLLPVFVCLSCTQPATAIVVAVDADGATQSEIDEVRVVLTRKKTQTVGVPSPMASLPGTLTLLPDGDDDGPLDVEVVGLSKGIVRISRRSILGFSPQKTKLLRTPLRSACLGKTCGDARETCDEGNCVSAVVPDSSQLPDFTSNDDVLGRSVGAAGVGGAAGAGGAGAPAGAGGSTAGAGAGNAGSAGSAGASGGVGSGLPTSCKAVLAATPTAASGVYPLALDGSGASFDAYCEMTDDGGGWTLLLKADGNAAASNFFYDDPLWTNAATLNPLSADKARTEAKLASFSTVSFTGLRIVAVAKDNVERGLTLAVAGTSLLSLLSANVFIPTTAGRASWLATFPGKIQPNCDREGLGNVVPVGPTYGSTRVRIGLLGNNEADCISPDSMVGVGASITALPNPSPCAPGVGKSVGIDGGNTASGCDGGPNVGFFAYVFAR